MEKTTIYGNVENVTFRHITKKVRPFNEFEHYYEWRDQYDKAYISNRQAEKYNDLYAYVDSLNGDINALAETIKRYEESTMYYKDSNIANEAHVLTNELNRLKCGKERVIWDFSDIDRKKALDWRLNINLKGWEL